MWQRERQRWDRLPAPDEELEGRVEIAETLGEQSITTQRVNHREDIDMAGL